MKHVENLSNDRHAEEKRRALCERNEKEATFGTSKRVYRANDIRAKLDNTAGTWIGACFFAKNVMKFLRRLLCLIFAKTGFEALKKRVVGTIDDLVGVLPSPQVSWGKINYRTLNRQVFCYIVVVNGAENIFKWYQYCCSNVLPLKDK